MKARACGMKMIRRMLGILLVVVGVSTTWAWGRVARLAEPAPSAGAQSPTALFASWQPEGAAAPVLHRSIDQGQTWTALELPTGESPQVWASDSGLQLVVATSSGSVLRSDDQGDTWTKVAAGLTVSRVLWDDATGLYVGTMGQGLLHVSADGDQVDISQTERGLTSEPIVDLSLSGSRLYAATPSALYHSDDRGATWTGFKSLPEPVTAMVAVDAQTVYVGTATSGVYRSSDRGANWQPSWDGLGLAAGQMVRVTALRTDPSEPGLVYAAVDYVVGGTHLHASAGGVFATIDGDGSWWPMAGPRYPEAEPVRALAVADGQPMYAQAITDGGLQEYGPDTTSLVAALDSAEPKRRASATRLLGIAQADGVWSALLSALDDPEPTVSMAAAEALGRIADPASIPGLLLAMDHPSQDVRLGAARALGIMRIKAAIEPLRAMLLLGEGEEISVAGQALGRIGGPEVTSILLAALSDPLPSARWHVAMAALEEMGEPAVAPLAEMLIRHEAHDRRNAAEALGWIASPSASGALERALRKDVDPIVRGQAAWALGEIGEPAAQKALVRAVRRDPAPEVQAAAEWALSRLPVETVAAFGWASRVAPALSQLQTLRWLLLALSLAGAAWLVMKDKPLATVSLRFRFWLR